MSDFTTIGIFQPPVATFGWWKSRGCNVIIANVPPDNVPIIDYLAAAADLGMTVWIDPQNQKPSVVSKLRGFGKLLMPDEPEQIKNGKPKVSPADYEALAGKYRASGPVAGCFTGQVADLHTAFPNPQPKVYRQYLRKLGGDVSACWMFDLYPANREKPGTTTYHDDLLKWSAIVGGMTAADWERGRTGSYPKPWLPMMECGDQHIGGRAPTLNEFVGQCYSAKDLGASGICYFYHEFAGPGGSFSGYNVSPEIAAAMPAMAAELLAPPPEPPRPVVVVDSHGTKWEVKE